MHLLSHTRRSVDIYIRERNKKESKKKKKRKLKNRNT